MTSPKDIRLDVLAALRAAEDGDAYAARRVLRTCDDPEAAFLYLLRLSAMFAERWLGDGMVHALVDRLVAEEYAEEVDR